MSISLQDICLQAGDALAFEHTSWQIGDAEHWAILGPTGSGKSLLARALSRRSPLRYGQITYFFDPLEPQGRSYLQPGEILTLSAESHRDFLARYASYHQARWQSSEGDGVPSVRSLLLGEKEKISAEIDWICEFQLDYLLDRQLLHLSNGESRKVHLVQLLLQSPRLLILDDPYVGLDAQSRGLLAHAIDVLLRLHRPQILLLTPRGDEIPAGIENVLLVEGLRVAASGSRLEILAQAQSFEAAESFQGFTRGAVFDSVARQYERALSQDGSLAEKLVEMSAVTVTYGATNVLSGVDWVVRRSERWALSGHNGAGKTTLLSLILADNPQAYANEIRLFGVRRGSGESIWEIKRRIGWVSPELQAYYPRGVTSLEVVSSGFFDSVGLYRRPSASQNDLAHTWLDAFGIAFLAGKGFHSLSTGQQRLVLLARALVKYPPLLVLDEPCQGLDSGHRAYFLELLNHLCASTSLAMIYVTHYQEEIPAAVSHRLRLDRGKVVEKE